MDKQAKAAWSVCANTTWLLALCAWSGLHQGAGAPRSEQGDPDACKHENAASIDPCVPD